MKQILVNVLTNRLWNRRVIEWVLKVNQISYGLAGIVASSLEPKGLHPKHRLTNYHQWFVNNIDPDWSVLDIGCGEGVLTEALAWKARKVIGIEINENNFEKAKKNLPNVNFINVDATNFDFVERFDVVVLSNVLEHIKDRKTFLKKLSSISDRFLIRVPMINRDWLTLYKKELGLPWKLNSGHFIEYTEESFRRELEEVKLVIVTSSVQFGEIWAVVQKK